MKSLPNLLVVVNLAFGFKAAVVEFSPNPKPISQSPAEFLLTNVKAYEEYVKTASLQGCDIIVFPEYGLTSTEILKLKSEDASAWTQDICLDTEFGPIQELQRIAKENSIYLVANLATKEHCSITCDPDCPGIGYYHFNTEFAFDRHGHVVSMYRKNNLYGEEHIFQRPKGGPDISYFDTDFGVRVGLFICFDIHFQIPWSGLKNHGVDVIAFSTAWKDEIPFLTALQYHPGWALANNVSVLSSNYLDIGGGGFGSGIYHGSDGILNYSSADIGVNKMIISEIPRESPGSPNDNSLTLEGRFFLEENMENYSHLELKNGSQSLELSLDNQSHCSVNYSLISNNEAIAGKYYFVGFRGLRTFGGGRYRNGISSCGILHCKGGPVESLNQCLSQDLGPLPMFDWIDLTMVHKTGEHPMPVGLDSGFHPLIFNSKNYHSTTSNDRTITRIDSRGHIYSFGLYARVYDLDQDSMCL